MSALGELAAGADPPADAIELPIDLRIVRDEPFGRGRDGRERICRVEADPDPEIPFGGSLQGSRDPVDVPADGPGTRGWPSPCFVRR